MSASNEKFREFIVRNIDPEYLTWAMDISGNSDARAINEIQRLAALASDDDVRIFFPHALISYIHDEFVQQWYRTPFHEFVTERLAEINDINGEVGLQ